MTSKKIKLSESPTEADFDCAVGAYKCRCGNDNFKIFFEDTIKIISTIRFVCNECGLIYSLAVAL